MRIIVPQDDDDVCECGGTLVKFENGKGVDYENHGRDNSKEPVLFDR